MQPFWVAISFSIDPYNSRFVETIQVQGLCRGIERRTEKVVLEEDGFPVEFVNTLLEHLLSNIHPGRPSWPFHLASLNYAQSEGKPFARKDLSKVVQRTDSSPFRVY